MTDEKEETIRRQGEEAACDVFLEWLEEKRAAAIRGMRGGDPSGARFNYAQMVAYEDAARLVRKLKLNGST